VYIAGRYFIKKSTYLSGIQAFLGDFPLTKCNLVRQNAIESNKIQFSPTFRIYI
jgi:hypothetical protein